MQFSKGTRSSVYGKQRNNRGYLYKIRVRDGIPPVRNIVDEDLSDTVSGYHHHAPKKKGFVLPAVKKLESITNVDLISSPETLNVDSAAESLSEEEEEEGSRKKKSTLMVEESKKMIGRKNAHSERLLLQDEGKRRKKSTFEGETTEKATDRENSHSAEAKQIQEGKHGKKSNLMMVNEATGLKRNEEESRQMLDDEDGLIIETSSNDSEEGNAEKLIGDFKEFSPATTYQIKKKRTHVPSNNNTMRSNEDDEENEEEISEAEDENTNDSSDSSQHLPQDENDVEDQIVKDTTSSYKR